jgi:hypothetical protein
VFEFLAVMEENFIVLSFQTKQFQVFQFVALQSAFLIKKGTNYITKQISFNQILLKVLYHFVGICSWTNRKLGLYCIHHTVSELNLKLWNNDK